MVHIICIHLLMCPQPKSECEIEICTSSVVFFAWCCFLPPRQGPAKHVEKPISCEAFLASACATFDCNSPMPARPCHREKFSGLGKLRSWKGLTTRISWVFCSGGKTNRKTTFGNWCGGIQTGKLHFWKVKM